MAVRLLVVCALLCGATGCKSLAKTTARRTAARAVGAAVMPAPERKPLPPETRTPEERHNDLRAARYLRDCVKNGSAPKDCVRSADELHALPESGYGLH